MKQEKIMPQTPNIIVQLIHIQGPFKGEIQEFSEPVITIGRHPSCNVQFPKDMAIISRKHAAIERDGNRFKLIDQSTNGTFVNGKQAGETYLNPGDVITFADDTGPKISFLTEMRDIEIKDGKSGIKDQDTEIVPLADFNNMGNAVEKKDIPAQEVPLSPPIQEKEPDMPQEAQVADMPEIVIENIKVPLAIQFGPTLKSYRELPIIMGRHPACDFQMEHPDIYDRHAQIFFSIDSYGIKDLTGKNCISVNGSPISTTALLKPNDILSLGPSGPVFKFIAGGRLAEVEETVPQAQPPDDNDKAGPVPKENGKKGKSVFNKLFKR